MALRRTLWKRVPVQNARDALNGHPELSQTTHKLAPFRTDPNGTDPNGILLPASHP
jgi:hypothetical protein